MSAFPPVCTWLEDVGQTALNQVAQVTQIQNCKPHWYSGYFPSKKSCSFFPPLPPSLWVLYLSCSHYLISHLCGKVLGELPATPLCPEVLSIAVDLLFISSQDWGASGPLLGLQWPHSKALLPKPSPFPVRPLFCANFLQPLSVQRCSLGLRPYLALKMKFWVSQLHIWTIQGPPPCLSFAQYPCLCGISIRDSNTTGPK